MPPDGLMIHMLRTPALYIEKSHLSIRFTFDPGN